MCLRFLGAREALKTHGCLCELRGLLAALPLSGRNHSLWRCCVCAHPSLIELFSHLRVHDLGRGSDRRSRIEVVPQALIHSNKKLCVVQTYSWWCDSRANLTDIGKISLSKVPPGSNAAVLVKLTTSKVDAAWHPFPVSMRNRSSSNNTSTKQFLDRLLHLRKSGRIDVEQIDTQTTPPAVEFKLTLLTTLPVPLLSLLP